MRDRQKGKIMTENDIIAEYVKRKYPEILTTVDFAAFHVCMDCKSFSDAFSRSIRNIDFSKLKEALKHLNERK